MSNGKTRMLFLSSSLVTAVMFTPMWSENVSAYAPDEDDPNAQDYTEEDMDNSQPYLLKHDQGSDVEQLQSDLGDRGYNVQVDGIFGPETENAVKAYQSDQGLDRDGVAGSNTYQALASDETLDEEPDTATDEAPDTSRNGELSNENLENQDSSASEIAATAESVLGTPYVWGGTTPDGFDSSGFINYVFDQNGIDVSRTHAEMWENDGEHVTSMSIGDVVFFEGTYDTTGASHSGIYIGDNQMIHAGSEGVVQADITSDYWQDHFIGFKTMQ
ncbi:NlpC/P60 family protein [Natribacillus halophilus]|uniref:Cell wall-associated hydrolase, NlpC family n=1 Tax=Natribacillus halophilus TaxID=549003 RepID=A0A1G8RG92_9BACI|nr:NlpC/P60 family protein [Natribacillus halophilus]SDJ15400.1 Cell wall-associated hydrolase, NlpC family [Natribacillus halophilus]